MCVNGPQISRLRQIEVISVECHGIRRRHRDVRGRDQGVGSQTLTDGATCAHLSEPILSTNSEKLHGAPVNDVFDVWSLDVARTASEDPAMVPSLLDPGGEVFRGADPF
jgi:hypothetical protein